MAFRTKLDLSNNRQAKQREQTTWDLLGKTNFGLPLSGMSSGVDYTTSAATNTYENVSSTFIGTLSATTFTFGLPTMNSATPYMNVITPSNFNDDQIIEPHFIGVNPHTNPVYGNTVYQSYSGVSFDFTVTNFVEYAPNQFSGTATSDVVILYSAGSLDYDGDGIWVNVQGKTKTEKLAIAHNPEPGKVLICLDYSGNTEWGYASGATTGSDSLFTSGSSGSHSVRIKGVPSTDSTNDYAFSMGFSNLSSGYASFSQGFGNVAAGNHSITRGISNNTSGVYSSILGNANLISAAGNVSNIFGSNNSVYEEFSNIFGFLNTIYGKNGLIVGSSNSILSGVTHTAILGSSGTTANTSFTTYVDKLNIKSMYSGASTTTIGVNAQGFVVDVLSDRRLKENINTIEGALEKVNALRGVTYQWKDKFNGGDKLRIGFIAQEVNEIIPELVFESSDGKYFGVHYDNVTALLVEAIKEIASPTYQNKITSTETIVAEDNNIELNFGGNRETALGGGIKIINGVDDGVNSEININENGDWEFNPNIKIKKYTPKDSTDTVGNVGNVCYDDDFYYIRTEQGWKRTKLENF